MCGSGEAEDASHFVFRCNPAQYEQLEETLRQRLSGTAPRVINAYRGMREFDRLRLFLAIGAAFDTRHDTEREGETEREAAERERLSARLSEKDTRLVISRTVENFLLTRWRHRTSVVGHSRNGADKGSLVVVPATPPR